MSIIGWWSCSNLMSHDASHPLCPPATCLSPWNHYPPLAMWLVKANHSCSPWKRGWNLCVKSSKTSGPISHRIIRLRLWQRCLMVLMFWQSSPLAQTRQQSWWHSYLSWFTWSPTWRILHCVAVSSWMIQLWLLFIQQIALRKSR